MARVSIKSPLPYSSSTSYRSSYISSTMPKRYDTTYTHNDLRSTRNYGSPTVGTSSYRSPTSRYIPTSTYTSERTTSLRKRAPSPSTRPLPPGPGPQDAYGRKLSIRDNLGSHRTSVYTVNATDTRSRPIRGDHTTRAGKYSPSFYRSDSVGYSSSSTSSSPLRKRTGSVSDLSKNFDSMRVRSPSVSYTRQYGSNMDLSRSQLNTPDKTSKESLFDSENSFSSTKRSTTLPDIKGSTSRDGRKTSRSPPTTDRSSRDRKTDDVVVKRALYADSRHSSQSSSFHASNSLDYNHNKSNGVGQSASSETSGLVGLRNLGNTCFMNSVIQSLSNTQSLLEYCLESHYEDEINNTTSTMKGALIKSYGKLMKTLWKTTGSSAVSPTDFKSQISKFASRFIGYSQQDAQEFLVYLLEGLHEDLNRVQKKKKRFIDDSCAVETISSQDKSVKMWKHYITCDNSKIVDIFVGQLKSSLTCTVCDYKSNTFDPFWQLSLPIKKVRSSVSLRDCLDLFTQQETLEGDERPMCAKCQQRQRCTKRFYIQKFPKVLVIHLKRFNQGAYIRSKLSTCVDYPVDGLNLGEYAADHCNSPVLYNLYATINHSGSTVGGHYTADTKHPYSGQWNHFDDTRVSSTRRHEPKTAGAYVLFYQLADHHSHL